ncbi:MAG: hypothetical protein HY569_03045 [Candidatus Magasanikbacteria bacterium]|nr:hypothetical protein [Candidatus Magasanikbacteria bacterium]
MMVIWQREMKKEGSEMTQEEQVRQSGDGSQEPAREDLFQQEGKSGHQTPTEGNWFWGAVGLSPVWPS